MKDEIIEHLKKDLVFAKNRKHFLLMGIYMFFTFLGALGYYYVFDYGNQMTEVTKNIVIGLSANFIAFSIIFFVVDMLASWPLKRIDKSIEQMEQWILQDRMDKELKKL